MLETLLACLIMTVVFCIVLAVMSINLWIDSKKIEEEINGEISKRQRQGR